MANEQEIRSSFFKNGFYGPFKVYEPSVARSMLMDVRKNSQRLEKAVFKNDCQYDRHLDIDVLSEHVCNPTVLAHVRALMGLDLVCWRTEFFPKFPGATGTEWHQVERFQYTTGTPQLKHMNAMPGEDPFELTVWTAFTESNVENGCMKFLPGSHRFKYFDESITPKTGRSQQYSSITSETSFFGYNFSEFKVDPNWAPNEQEAVSMVMAPGEAVVFTARCVHGSHPNVTKDKTRFAISSRYVSTDVQVYPNQESFVEHGGFFDLKDYGVVLVSGQDVFMHNRVRTESNTGFKFRAAAL